MRSAPAIEDACPREVDLRARHAAQVGTPSKDASGIRAPRRSISSSERLAQVGPVADEPRELAPFTWAPAEARLGARRAGEVRAGQSAPANVAPSSVARSRD